MQNYCIPLLIKDFVKLGDRFLNPTAIDATRKKLYRLHFNQDEGEPHKWVKNEIGGIRQIQTIAWS